jgi:acetyl esterase/lipase
MANYDTPGPTIHRFLDFQRLYLATQEDGENWQASPVRVSLENLREWPVAEACIALAKADPLYHEGAKFARMLRRVEKAPAVMEVEGAPHIITNLGGVMEKSRELLGWLIAYMAERFGCIT